MKQMQTMQEIKKSWEDNETKSFPQRKQRQNHLLVPERLRGGTTTRGDEESRREGPLSKG
jgi:hypothetical protein